MEKVGNIQEQMDNVSREMEILKSINKKCSGWKTPAEMKGAFDRLINGLEMAEEGTSEREDMTIGTSKTERQRGEKAVRKKEQHIQDMWDNDKRVI